MGLFGALYPAYIYLCRTLRLRSCDRPRMTRGQDGSLLLFLYDSFIHDSTPVYPDAPQSRPWDPQPCIETMKIMTKDSSATVREKTPHASNSIQQTISNALRRRAQSVVKDRSIDA